MVDISVGEFVLAIAGVFIFLVSEWNLLLMIIGVSLIGYASIEHKARTRKIGIRKGKQKV